LEGTGFEIQAGKGQLISDSALGLIKLGMLKIEVKKVLPGFKLDVKLSADNGILAILGPSGSA
jgi:hypothetical protein